MFVDQVKVHLRAGNGGAGVVAYQRTKGRPKGKPQGGNGGGAEMSSSRLTPAWRRSFVISASPIIGPPMAPTAKAT